MDRDEAALAVVARAIATATPPTATPPVTSWQEAFAVPLRPFLEDTRTRLANGARSLLPAAYADPARIAGSVTSVLARRLARLAVRTLAAELGAARDAGRLAGADGQQRFIDFIRQMSAQAGLAGLCRDYPVLARLLGLASWQAAEAGLELLARFAADRAELTRRLLGGTDPGPVVAVETGLGDAHRQGRTVAALSFADGRKLMYKPRDVSAYVFFGEVAGWLNSRLADIGLRTAATLARPGYGWQEFIEFRPTTGSQVGLFYQRQGTLLAALYALRAADIHCENLIACGDQPVLVDVETLFHPTLPAAYAIAEDPAGEALASSVWRTGLLPCVRVSERGPLDLSGMGGDADGSCLCDVLDWDPPATDELQLVHRAVPFAGARNRPRADDKTVEPADYEAAVLDGFRLGYDAILRDQHEFLRLVADHSDLAVRVVIRSSQAYARLLDESTQPGMLRTAKNREAAFDALRQTAAQHRLWHLACPDELADLNDGDIPLLTGRADSTDLWSSAGRRLPDALDQPGLAHALAQIAAMGEVDRTDQEWLISASLATRRPLDGHRSAELIQAQPTAAAPDRLLAAACGLADHVVASSVSGQDRVNWFGLQLVEDTRWMVLPMGADLASGYIGVALFLAQAAALTGISRYTETALHALRPLPRLLDALAGRPDLLDAVGCGGLEGLGGISYGLARIATLLGSAELRTAARQAVDLTARAAGPASAPGWTRGIAGCLAAMTAVRHELGSAAAGELATVCADRLADIAERTAGRCEPDAHGFAAGAAGIAWALTRFAAASAGQAADRYAAAGRLAARAAAPPDGARSYGWCQGAAGWLMARSCLTGDSETPASRPVLAASRPVLADLSLCHGELGIADAQLVLAAISPGQGTWREPGWRAGENHVALRHRAGLVLDALGRGTRYCGTPGGVPTSGLLSGLSGIGYGLLRLGFAGRVPSVLFLEPTSSLSVPRWTTT